MINGDVKDFMATFGDSLATVVSAIAGAVIGFLLGLPKHTAEIRKLEQEAAAAQENAETSHLSVMMAGYERRIQVLIDGYEARVADLTREVETLRVEVKSLRKALDVCKMCERSPAHTPLQGQQES